MAEARPKMDDEPVEDKPMKALDAGDIALLKSYGVGPYTKAIKTAEDDIKAALKRWVIWLV